MDLDDDDDWVDVPYDGLLVFNDDKSPTQLFKSGYFNIPKTSLDQVEDEELFERRSDHKEEVTKLPILIKEFKETLYYDLDTDPDHDLELKSSSSHDPIFHDFFKKENQFVEMKKGSLRESSQEYDLSRIETPQFQNDEKHGDHMVNCSSPSKMIKKEVAWKASNQGLNIWKWGLSRIGVFCSIGMTAATICVIVCGSDIRHKQQNKKLRFQIYPDNKRIKQVMQKANEAMSAARGVPLVKAQITYGGHYETL